MSIDISRFDPPSEQVQGQTLAKFDPPATSSGQSDKDSLIDMVISKAEQYGVPPDIALAHAKQESGLNPTAKSPTGVRGLFQVTLNTGRMYKPDYNETDRGNPEISADIGIRHLADLYNEQGSWPKASMAYNGGSDPNYALNVGKHLGWAQQEIAKRKQTQVKPVDIGRFDPPSAAQPEQTPPPAVNAFTAPALDFDPTSTTLAQFAGNGEPVVTPQDFANPIGMAGDIYNRLTTPPYQREIPTEQIETFPSPGGYTKVAENFPQEPQVFVPAINRNVPISQTKERFEKNGKQYERTLNQSMNFRQTDPMVFPGPYQPPQSEVIAKLPAKYEQSTMGIAPPRPEVYERHGKLYRFEDLPPEQQAEINRESGAGMSEFIKGMGEGSTLGAYGGGGPSPVGLETWRTAGRYAGILAPFIPALGVAGAVTKAAAPLAATELGGRIATSGLAGAGIGAATEGIKQSKAGAQATADNLYKIGAAGANSALDLMLLHYGGEMVGPWVGSKIGVGQTVLGKAAQEIRDAYYRNVPDFVARRTAKGGMPALPEQYASDETIAEWFKTLPGEERAKLIKSNQNVERVAKDLQRAGYKQEAVPVGEVPTAKPVQEPPVSPVAEPTPEPAQVVEPEVKAAPAPTESVAPPKASAEWTRPKIIRYLRAGKPVPHEVLSQHTDLVEQYASKEALEQFRAPQESTAKPITPDHTATPVPSGEFTGPRIYKEKGWFRVEGTEIKHTTLERAQKAAAIIAQNQVQAPQTAQVETSPEAGAEGQPGVTPQSTPPENVAGEMTREVGGETPLTKRQIGARNAKITKQLKTIDDLLVQEAISKAQSANDEWNLQQFQIMSGKKIQRADRGLLNDYLFGDTEGREVDLEQSKKQGRLVLTQPPPTPTIPSSLTGQPGASQSLGLETQAGRGVEGGGFPTLIEFAKSKLPQSQADQITKESQVKSFKGQWEKERKGHYSSIANSFNQNEELKTLDASVKKIEEFDPKGTDWEYGYRYKVEVSYPDSIDERGYYTDFDYKHFPTIQEINKDVRDLYVKEKKRINSPMDGTNIVAKTGSEEILESAIDKVLTPTTTIPESTTPAPPTLAEKAGLGILTPSKKPEIRVFKVEDYTPWQRQNMDSHDARQNRLEYLYRAREDGYEYAQIGSRKMKLGAAIKQVEGQASINERIAADKAVRAEMNPSTPKPDKAKTEPAIQVPQGEGKPKNKLTAALGGRPEAPGTDAEFRATHGSRQGAPEVFAAKQKPSLKEFVDSAIKDRLSRVGGSEIGYVTVKRPIGKGMFRREAYGLDGKKIASGGPSVGKGSISDRLSRRTGKYRAYDLNIHDIGPNENFTKDWYVNDITANAKDLYNRLGYNKRGPANYDLQKALDRGDLRTIVLAEGGLPSKSQEYRNFEPEERSKLFPFFRPGAVEPDVRFTDLKEKYPEHFGRFDLVDDFLRALVNKDYKTFDIEKEAEEHDRDLEEQAKSEGVTEATLAATEADVKREIIDEHSEATGQSSELSAAELNSFWDEAEKESLATKAKSKLETRLNELQSEYPGLDAKHLELVLKTFPDGPTDQIVRMAKDPKLYDQLRKQHLKKLNDAGGDSDQMQTIPGLGGDMFTDMYSKPQAAPAPASSGEGVDVTGPKQQVGMTQMPIAVSASNVSSQLAQAAHMGSSFTPEVRGKQRQSDYVNHMKGVFEEFKDKVKTPEQQEYFTEALGRYKSGFLKRYNSALEADSRTMSSMIAGPSNFPVEKNRKRLETARNRWNELEEYSAKAIRAMRRELSGKKPISSDEADATTQLQNKIDKAEKLQETMVPVNKIVKSKKLSADEKITKIQSDVGLSEGTAKKLLEPDYMGRKGFADYQLKNNNANIRRMKERIGEIEKTRSQGGGEMEFDGGKVVDNIDDNRLQIFFDSKPPAETIKNLKANGFKWAPSIGAWQRMRGPGAEAALQRAIDVKFEATPGIEEGSAAEKAAFKVSETAPSETKPGAVKMYSFPGIDTEDLVKIAKRISKTLFPEITGHEEGIKYLFAGAGPTPATYKLFTRLWNQAKFAKQEYFPDISKKDMSLVAYYMDLPFWRALEDPKFKRVYDVQTTRENLRNWANDELLGELEPTMQWWKTISENDRQIFNDAVWHFDKIRKEPTDEQLTEKGLSDEAITHYRAMREMLDYIWDDDMSHLLHNLGMPKNDIDKLRRARGKIAGFFPHLREGKYFVYARTEGKQWTTRSKKDGSPVIYKSEQSANSAANFINGKKRELTNDSARAVETPDGWTVQYQKKASTEHFELFNDILATLTGGKASYKAGKRMRELKGEYPKQQVKAGPITKMPEEAFFHVDTTNMQAIIDAAVNQAELPEGVESDDLRNALLEAVARNLQTRGFGEHFIPRKDVPGFDQTDPIKAVIRFVQSYNGYKTKLVAARAFSDAMKGIGAKSREWRFASKYVKDMLANSEAMDRTSDKLRAGFFMYFLGGVARQILLQPTQNFLAFVPAIQQYTKWSSGKITAEMARAGKDIVVNLGAKAVGKTPQALERRMNPDEISAMEVSRKRGILADQLTREYGTYLLSTMGKVGRGIMQASSFFIGNAEKFNRQTAWLVSYRIARNELGYDRLKGIDFAEQMVEMAHFRYGKANLPGAFRGGEFNKLLRSSYAFRSYNANLLRLYAHLGTGGTGKISNVLAGPKTVQMVKTTTPTGEIIYSRRGSRSQMGVLKGLLALLAFGGLSSLWGYKWLEKEIQSRTGKNIRSEVKRSLGRLGDMINFGLPAAAGIDLSGSLGMESPQSVGEVIGVPWALGSIPATANEFYQKGDYYRTLETLAPSVFKGPMKAVRWGLMEGMLTKRGKGIKDETGDILRFTPYEIGLKTASFRTVKEAEMQRQFETEKNLETPWKERRDNLLSEYRTQAQRYGRFSKQAEAVVDKMDKFNDNRDKAGVDYVPKIMSKHRVNAIKGKESKYKKRLKEAAQ